MNEKNVPAMLCDFELKQAAKIKGFIPLGLSSRSGYEEITGNMPYISRYYDLI